MRAAHACRAVVDVDVQAMFCCFKCGARTPVPRHAHISVTLLPRAPAPPRFSVPPGAGAGAAPTNGSSGPNHGLMGHGAGGSSHSLHTLHTTSAAERAHHVSATAHFDVGAGAGAGSSSGGSPSSAELLCGSCGCCIACGSEFSNYHALATPQKSCSCSAPAVVLVPENDVLHDRDALARLSRELLLELLAA